MTVKNLVGTLTRTGVSTAVSVVRHPIGTASWAAGLVKGTAEVGVHIVRTVITGELPAPTGDITDQKAAETAAERAPRSATEPATEPATGPATGGGGTVAADPRDEIPGPDLAAFEPPAPEDLPEPIVIEAEPAHGPGESFHNEPKAATRESAHGGVADPEEIAGYVDEIAEDDFDLETDVLRKAADQN